MRIVALPAVQFAPTLVQMCRLEFAGFTVVASQAHLRHAGFQQVSVLAGMCTVTIQALPRRSRGMRMLQSGRAVNIGVTRDAERSGFGQQKCLVRTLMRIVARSAFALCQGLMNIRSRLDCVRYVRMAGGTQLAGRRRLQVFLRRGVHGVTRSTLSALEWCVSNRFLRNCHHGRMAVNAQIVSRLLEQGCYRTAMRLMTRGTLSLEDRQVHRGLEHVLFQIAVTFQTELLHWF